VDEMIQGIFHSFTHVHRFTQEDRATAMLDIFKYKSPLGPLGWLADRLFLERYMRRFLKRRAFVL